MLDNDFLNLVRNQIPVHARKEILKASLAGIADLHDRDIVHLGKPRYMALRQSRRTTELRQMSSLRTLWSITGMLTKKLWSTRYKYPILRMQPVSQSLGVSKDC